MGVSSSDCGDTAASRSPLALPKSQLNFSTGTPEPAHCCNSWLSHSPAGMGFAFQCCRTPTSSQGEEGAFLCIF